MGTGRAEPAVAQLAAVLFRKAVDAAPEAFAVVPSDLVPPPAARRNLVLITKLLQNLANNVSFGKKEAYMVPMNSFVFVTLK